MTGLPREQRRYKVVEVPMGPEQGANTPPVYVEKYAGTLADTLEYYDYLRERGDQGTGRGIAVIDGMGQLVYACS